MRGHSFREHGGHGLANLLCTCIGLQETKRHRSDHFVYQRQEQDDHFGDRPAGPQVPVIHTFSPRRKSGPGESSPAAKPAGRPYEADQDVNPPTTPGHENAEPRQYHVSRQDMLRANSQSLKQSRDGVSKKRQAPAVFVERKIKQVSAKKLERIRSRGDVRASSPAPPPFVDTDMDGMDVDPKTPPRKYKKPGIAKFVEDNNEARGAKAEAPAAIMDRWQNVDLGQLSAEMNAYTLEQIGLNIKQADEEEQRRRNSAKKQTLASPMKYKPKAPVQRYAERHPDPPPAKPDNDMVDKDDNMSDGSDDDDYIIETYVRVPASRIGDHVPPQTVGLLVFDGEPDIEYFYGDASDSEDEWAEDEEDENGESGRRGLSRI